MRILGIKITVTTDQGPEVAFSQYSQGREPHPGVDGEAVVYRAEEAIAFLEAKLGVEPRKAVPK